MPPKQLTSIKARDCVGWISMSLDGRFAYSSTGEVICCRITGNTEVSRSGHDSGVLFRNWGEIRICQAKNLKERLRQIGCVVHSYLCSVQRHGDFVIARRDAAAIVR